MTTNRFGGVRCAVSWNRESARLSRAHNDANVLSVGQRLVPKNDVLAIVDVWLETPFDGGRHIARIRKIDEPWSAKDAPGGGGAGEDSR
jgi:ribose 5-phosphate isomerase B